jgi:hypothetical protein
MLQFPEYVVQSVMTALLLVFGKWATGDDNPSQFEFGTLKSSSTFLFALPICKVRRTHPELPAEIVNVHHSPMTRAPLTPSFHECLAI